MPDELDINKVKYKTADELLPNERDFIIANRDKLDEEDEAAFASFLPAKEEDLSAPDGSGDGGDGAAGDAGNGSGEQGNSDAGDDGSSEQPYFFTSEEEARAFVEKQIEEREKARREAEAANNGEQSQDSNGETTPKWVDPDWKPQDWNEGIQKAAEAALALSEQKKAEEDAKMKANADRLESEWQDISKEHSLPAIDTPEGRKIHDQIVTVALKHGKQTFPEAYELWSQIPEKLGGGFKIEASDAGAALAKSKMNAQKQAAGSVAKGSGGSDKKQGVQWTPQDLRTKSLDQLLEIRSGM